MRCFGGCFGNLGRRPTYQVAPSPGNIVPMTRNPMHPAHQGPRPSRPNSQNPRPNPPATELQDPGCSRLIFVPAITPAAGARVSRSEEVTRSDALASLNNLFGDRPDGTQLEMNFTSTFKNRTQFTITKITY